MSQTFHHTLLNGPFGDPCLQVRIAHEARSLLFDLGDIHFVLPSALNRITDVFVLGGSDDTADSVHGQLLHHAVDGGGKLLKVGPVLGFGHLVLEAAGLLRRLGQIVVQAVPVFRDKLAAGLVECGDSRIGLLELAPLHQDVLLHPDQFLEVLQILQL